MTEFGKRAGDMSKSVYDADKDGIVDNSELLEGKSKAQVQDHIPKSHTHTEAEIDDLDHDALKIKGVTVNDSAKADQKVLAFVSDPGEIQYITQAPSGAALNSIQQGEIDLHGAGVLSHTLTINSVDVDKSILIYGGILSGSNDPIYGTSRIEITNATTITAYRGVSHALDSVSTFTVIEFSSGIKSVQSGTIIMTDAENTANINEVDTSKSFVIYLGAAITMSDWANGVCNLELTNSTTVTCKNSQANAAAVVGFMVVEFD
ncbi:hypothetical protein ES703_17922 [subsurface metagenome]